MTISTLHIREASRQFSQVVNQAAYGYDAEQPLLPLAEFQVKFQAALAAAGYDTRQKILALVRDVKIELAVEAGLLPDSTTPTTETE